MYEIYDNHADRYDALVTREDCEGNLRRALRDGFRWEDAVVVEAGIGTGRVTGIYIDLVRKVYGFDRSPHMLARAGANLEAWSARLALATGEHRSLPVDDDTADVFVEGWAFGHLVVDHHDEVERVTEELIAEANRVIRPGGRIVILETLGTNVAAAAAPLPSLAHFYDLLVERHGFRREVIRTDYRFETRGEAEEICGYFFGDAMRKSIRDRASRQQSGAAGFIVPEFTGIWSRG